MFTGIIETSGQITAISGSGSNLTFTIKSGISAELKTDQSVAHDGVCLTVESVTDSSHTVTAIEETLQKTTLGNWQTGNIINLERCLTFNARVDGHFVQGHVDARTVCLNRELKAGSIELRFEIPPGKESLLIEKGSVTINGISLTCFNVTQTSFTVAIIPYTAEHTNIGLVETGSLVNLEFDMIGKYIERIVSLRGGTL